MVGDTESDMGAGHAAGFSAVIGIVGVRDAAYLRRFGATHVVTGLPQVQELLLGVSEA